MLVRLLGFGEALSDQGQVFLGSRRAGVRDTEDAPQAPNRVLEKFLGKDQFVSRGSGTLHDRMHVHVSQPEAQKSLRNARAALRKSLRAREAPGDA